MLETEILNIKILRTDKIALRRLATQEGESIAVVARRILRDELKRKGLLQPAPTHPQHTEATYAAASRNG